MENVCAVLVADGVERIILALGRLAAFKLCEERDVKEHLSRGAVLIVVPELIGQAQLALALVHKMDAHLHAQFAVFQ